MNANPMLSFKEEAPEAALAFDGLIKALCARDAVLMTLTVSGIRGVVSCLGPALQAYDGLPA